MTSPVERQNPPEVLPPGFGAGWVDRVCVILACLGGVILVLLSAMVTASVLGRRLFGSEVPGAYELVQVGVAVAAFLFLPICQVRHRNIVVDSLTARSPPRLRSVLDGLWALLYGAVAVVLAWRLLVGAEETIRYGMVTTMIQFPFGWAMLVGVAALLFLAFTAAFVAWRRLRGARP